MHHKSRSYNVWFLRYKVQRTMFFCILGHFLPFDLPNNPKNQNFKKIKKCLEILSFYTCVPQLTIICCMFPEISSVTDNFLSFWAIFCPFTPLTTQKIKVLKKWKKVLKISFYTHVAKKMTRWCTVPEIWCMTDRQTDRQMEGPTEGWKKWHIDVGTPLKK